LSNVVRCQVVVDGCVHRLTINNATLEDEAEYTVKLTDNVSTKATLWVEGTIRYDTSSNLNRIDVSK